MNTRRMNRLEELGRVDAEKAFTKKGARNLRDEKKRIVRELKAEGGKVKRPKRGKIQDGAKAHARDMQKTGRGKEFRKNTFVDSKTGRIVPDSPRNRKRYGKDIFGRDTGRIRATTAKGIAKKAEGGSLKPVKPSQKGLKKLPTKVRNKMGYMKKGGRVGMGKALRGGGCVR